MVRTFDLVRKKPINVGAPTTNHVGKKRHETNRSTVERRGRLPQPVAPMRYTIEEMVRFKESEENK